MAAVLTNVKSRHIGVTMEEYQDLISVETDYAIAHCTGEDLKISAEMNSAFKKRFGKKGSERFVFDQDFSERILPSPESVVWFKSSLQDEVGHTSET